MKKTITCILLVLCTSVIGLGAHRLSAAAPLGLSLGPVSFAGGCYSYPNAAVTGDGIKTVLIGFSQAVTEGDRIILPTETPSGFAVSDTSAVNNYVKRINLQDGVTSAELETYLRGVTFAVASASQSVELSVTTQSIDYDTFYNIDTQHYYQYIPDNTKYWTQAYQEARGMTYMGRTGYLATITSYEEDVFVNALSGGKTGWLGGTILTNTGASENALYYDGFNTASVVEDGWYWACGPERGSPFYDAVSMRINHNNEENANHADEVDGRNSQYYFNWGRGPTYYEPNNKTTGAIQVGTGEGDFETCLTTLVISLSNGGKHGTLFSWNDKHYTAADTNNNDQWKAKGYFVEYGDRSPGDSGMGSDAFATAMGTLRPVFDVTVATQINGSAADMAGEVQLWQNGRMVVTAVRADTGVYTAQAMDGGYDVYINGEDMRTGLAVDGAAADARVNFYTVAYSVADAGLARNSTVLATADEVPVESGAAVLSGKTVVLTAVGEGAERYTYAWSGDGADGAQEASLTVRELDRPVEVACIVTGHTGGPKHVQQTGAITEQQENAIPETGCDDTVRMLYAVLSFLLFGAGVAR